MIAGIILASGYSKRMKKNKLMMLINKKPMLEYVVDAASTLEQVLIVTQYESVVDHFESHSLKVIINENPECGMSESMRLGISALSHVSGYMIFLGDQPSLLQSTVKKIEEFALSNPNKIVIPYYQGIKGHPIYLPSHLKDELLAISGDIGAREVVKNHSDLIVRVDFDQKDSDIDTLEKLDEYRKEVLL